MSVQHFGGFVMYMQGHGLIVYCGGTNACNNETGGQRTNDRVQVNCKRCLKKLARHDHFETQPQPEIARKMRAAHATKEGGER